MLILRNILNMCGRFNEYSPNINTWCKFLSDWPTEFNPSYNRAPTSQIAAFRSGSGEMMRWGLIPNWADSFESRYATFNARIETVAEKPTFRSAWSKSQRCLIPMAGYYEWQGETGNKQPYYITDVEKEALLIAGLYDAWGEFGQLSCTILTKPADKTLAKIHHRMPIILTADSAEDWLFKDKDIGRLKAPKIEHFPVSKAVGNVRNNDPELIKPLAHS